MGKGNQKPAAFPNAGKRKRSNSEKEPVPAAESKDDESDSEDTGEHAPKLKRRRDLHSETSHDASDDLVKQNLPRLLDLMEYVKEENSRLKSLLNEKEDKETDWQKQKEFLEQRIQTLESKNKKLLESHQAEIAEERARCERERQRRKTAERQLKKFKKKNNSSDDED